MHSPVTPSRVTTAQVFAIAGPAMVANLTTPLIGIVSTTAIGRLGDAAMLGGVAMASVLFDCIFWLFGFLRMSTVAFTAQSLGAGETQELRAIRVRGFVVASLVGAALIALQMPLAAALFGAMGGSESVTHAAKTYFTIRIWSAPLALANYVVLGWLIGQARAALALATQVAINVTNMVATVTLVLVFDLGIAGAAIAAVFLDGLANAAEQLCGRAYGARDKNAFAGAVKLVVRWGFGFSLAVAACFLLFGPALIDMMTASADVRRIARDYLPFVIFAPLLGVFAFAYDGVYIGATWAREMRNLMLLSLLIFLAAWLALRGFGNAGLWGALLVHYAARGGLQALRYPAMFRLSFPKTLPA